MKFPHPTVLTPDKVEIGEKYILGALPAGVTFLHARKTYQTVTYPKFLSTATNAQKMAQVWRKALVKMEKMSYREEVKVISVG